MKRAAMLYCADCDVPRFKAMKHRDQLPFIDFDENEGTGVQRKYSLHEALLLRLALDFIGDDVRQNPLLTGVPASTAAKIVGNLSVFANDTSQKLEKDVWGGQVIIEESYADGSPSVRYSRWIWCNFDDLPAKMAEYCANNNHEVTHEIVRTNFVNVSRAARFVRQRAEDLGLDKATLHGFELP